MKTAKGLVKMYKEYCLDYLEQLKFEETGLNEVDVAYDMKNVMHLLDILEDDSYNSIDKLNKFSTEKEKVYWNFGFKA